MFVFNFKVNKNLLFKIIFVILFVCVLVIALTGTYKTFFANKTDTCTNKGKINVISSANYTNTLQTVHNNLDNYVGMKISMVVYVYRIYDFQDDQFVIARQMIISSDMQAVVVGFLCHLDEAKKYEDGTWLQIEGTITKGDYHGCIPTIEIEKAVEVEAPTDEYVYPPSDTYIPTSKSL